jgi:hypothetical protein
MHDYSVHHSWNFISRFLALQPSYKKRHCILGENYGKGQTLIALSVPVFSYTLLQNDWLLAVETRWRRPLPVTILVPLSPSFLLLQVLR